MADVDPKLMTFVEAELKKTPDISTNELFEKAKKKYPGAEELTVRQFHARYPLQVKRKMSLAKGGGRRKARRRPRRAARREAVREALMRFASDLSAAEERKDLVKLMSEIDRYVDDVLEAAKR